jgi:LysM repeat protein
MSKKLTANFLQPTKMKSKYYLLSLFVVCFLLAKANDGFLSVNSYIEQYKDIAIAEMERTGIPASIKMGQAILESSHGNSDLSRNSNNHFGIKCKKEWQGKKYYHKDDDRNKRGKLIKSCFRVYSSVTDSYIDHSNFLMTRDRYTQLFDIPSTDYKGWAKGLKSSGYATAKHYATKLIQIIEKNELYVLDFRAANSVIANTYAQNSQVGFAVIKPKSVDLSEAKVLNQKPILPIINEAPIVETAELEEEELPKVNYFPIKSNYKGVFLVNGLRVVALKDGQTLEGLAALYNVSVEKLLKYNDLRGDRALVQGQYIFLMSKESEFKGLDYHKVRAGETPYIISQLYGIRLEKLLQRNDISAFNILVVDRMIKLNNKKDKLKDNSKPSYTIKKVKRRSQRKKAQ